MNSYGNLIQYLWLGFSFISGVLQVLAAILLFRERSAAAWMILIGSILSVAFGLGSRLVIFFHNAGTFESSFETVIHYTNILGAVNALGGMLFIVGLVLFALSRRALSARIAELEQIIAAQNSRLQ
jgi:hypothetical protein